MKPELRIDDRKHLTVDPAQRHPIAQRVPPFYPPSVPTGLSFTPAELALSVARNLALRIATPALLAALGRSALELINLLLEPGEKELKVSSSVAMLGDAALNHFSHDIGAGIAGLLMERMDYVWRANGKELLGGKGRKPDYLWSRGVSSEVILSEVKGAAAPKVTKMRLNRRAEEGFEEQVCPWLGKSIGQGLAITWGYGIGVHTPGGGTGGCVVHEPEATSQVRLDGDIFVPLEIARAHYAAVFRLLGCFEIADALRTSRGFEEIGRPIAFDVVEQDGERLLVPERPSRRSLAEAILGRRWRFALEETAASDLLNYSTRDPLDPESALIRRVAAGEGRRLPVAPDGLALVPSHYESGGRRVWHPDGGFFGRLEE